MDFTTKLKPTLQVVEGNKLLAEISNACAIKVLQHELDKQNGTNCEELVDDLCLTSGLADERELLIDTIGSTADFLIKAASGQYFDKNEDNAEYRLRFGGTNYDQQINIYSEQMSDSVKDEYFFKFLEYNLPLDHDTYRSSFKIWQHSIDLSLIRLLETDIFSSEIQMRSLQLSQDNIFTCTSCQFLMNLKSKEIMMKMKYTSLWMGSQKNLKLRLLVMEQHWHYKQELIRLKN